jgi:UDP-glucose 4-epimerase
VDAAAEAPARIPRDLAAQERFTLLNEDLLEDGAWLGAAAAADCVIHLAANSDIRRSFGSPELDLRHGFRTTQRLLEAMRSGRCRRLAFASSSAVYGDTRRFPTPEDHGPLLPVSLYGAAKLASEGLISAYAHGYGFSACLFRPANVVGGEATHGVVYDFVRALRRDPRRLRILGDGRQRKPYLHAEECAEAIAWGMERVGPGARPFNVTPGDDLTVDQVADIVCDVLGLKGVERSYTGGERGWPGDVPHVKLDPGRLSRLGWTARLSSAQAAERAARELALATHWPLDTCAPAGL